MPFAALSSFFFFNTDITLAATTTTPNLLDMNGNLFDGFDSADYYPDKDLSFFKKVKWYFTSGDDIIFNFLADVFGLIFRLLAFVGLQTPTILFTNEITLAAVKVTSLASIAYTIGAWTYESFARMLNKPFGLKFTPFKSVVKRMPLAFLLGAGSPLVVTFFAKIANFLSALLNNNTAMLISNPKLSSFSSSLGEIISLFIFDAFMIYLLMPVIVKNAVRWWDIFTLTIISPLILVRSIFGENNNVIRDWLEKIKELLSVQLVNSGYIALLAFVLCASNATGFPFLSKMILIIGGMYRIANPPEFVMKANGFSKDNDYGQDFWKENKFSPLNAHKKLKDFKLKRKESKLELRKKLGKRSV